MQNNIEDLNEEVKTDTNPTQNNNNDGNNNSENAGDNSSNQENIEEVNNIDSNQELDEQSNIQNDQNEIVNDNNDSEHIEEASNIDNTRELDESNNIRNNQDEIVNENNSNQENVEETSNNNQENVEESNDINNNQELDEQNLSTMNINNEQNNIHNNQNEIVDENNDINTNQNRTTIINDINSPIPGENSNSNSSSQNPSNRTTVSNRPAADGPEEFVNRTLSINIPNNNDLENEINTITRSNTMTLARNKTTKEYLDCAKELIDSIKTNFGSRLLKDLDESYTRNVRGTLAKNDLAVLLKASEADNAERLYLETVRNKIIGNKTPSVEQYKNVLNTFAKVNQIINVNKPNKLDKENNAAFTEACGAVALVQTVLRLKGFDALTIDDLKPDTDEIGMYAEAVQKHQAVEAMLEWIDEHPIDPDIISNSKKTIDVIFNRYMKTEIDPKLVKAYDYIHNGQDELIDIDKNDAEEAKMYLEGNQFNVSNMRKIFSYRKILMQQCERFEKYEPANRSLPALKEAITNVTDFILTKKISLEKIELLSNLSHTDMDLENPEFDMQASLVLAPLEIKRIADVDVKDAVNKFYEELAINFDAAHNTYGADLSTKIYVSAAKTLKKMFDYQNALYETRKTDYDEISRHVAKVQKFLEIKGFTKAEIQKIKDPNIYLEDTYGRDGFQKLADRHWDMYAVDNKEVVIDEVNKPKVENTPVETSTVKNNRTQINIIQEENQLPTIENVTYFDETINYIRENNINMDIEQTNTPSELTENEFEYNIDNDNFN